MGLIVMMHVEVFRIRVRRSFGLGASLIVNIGRVEVHRAYGLQTPGDGSGSWLVQSAQSMLTSSPVRVGARGRHHKAFPQIATPYAA